MKRPILIVAVILLVSACATTDNKPGVDKVKLSEGYMTRGYAYLEVGNHELAITEFHRSLQENADNKWANYYLGITYDKLGKPVEAEQYYSEAIDIDSHFSEAYNALGVVYSKQKKWKEALRNFKKALENKLYSTRYLPYLNMGDVYMSQGEYTKAVEAYGESKRYEKIDFIIIKLGEALLESGKTKDAIKEFQEATTMSPSNPLARYRLAIAYLKDGNKGGAIVEFRKAAALAPGSEIALKSEDYLKTLR